MTKTIELIVAPDGTTKLQTKGFAGTECQTASRFLESALGNRQAEQLTAEFYSAASSQHQIQEGQTS